MPMKLTINGTERVCAATNLADLWRTETAALDIAEPRGFAISLNGEVVRRAAWMATPVRDGDAVEIIRAMSGG
jgi:sulfur carrier protein